MMNKLVKPAVYDYSARRKVIDSLCAEYEFIKRSVIGAKLRRQGYLCP